MNIDPTLIAGATAALEQSINQALKFDPASRQALAQQNGKSLALEIVELSVNLCFEFGEDEVRVTSQTADATTRLRGSLPGLIQLAISDSVNLSDSGVEAWGSTALLADLQRILTNIDIDWEDAISPLVGDVAAYTLVNSAKERLNWLGQRGKQSKRLLQEFITEELRATPHRSELESFNRGVDQLRLATDRLESRLNRLQQKSASAQKD